MTVILRKTDGTEKRTDEKVCTACEQLLPLSAFGKNSGTRDKLQYMCKNCLNTKANAAKKARKASAKVVKLEKVVTWQEELCSHVTKLVNTLVDMKIQEIKENL